METYPPSQEEKIQLKEYLRIIIQYKWVILIVFCVVLGATIFYTAQAPRVYESSGKVLIELQKETDLFFPIGGMTRNALNNQIEVLKSIPVLQATITKLQKHPESKNFPIFLAENPVSALRGTLKITGERETDIINITYASTNPVECEAVVNNLVDSYVEENLRYARSELTRIREFLEEQLDMRSRQLSVSEEALRRYKIENNIFALSEETKQMVENMAEFEAEFGIAKTDLEVAQQKLSYLQEELSKVDAALAQEVASISSPVAEGLRQKLIQDQSRLAIFLTKEGYTPDHPELQKLQREIDRTKQQMAEEINKALMVTKETFSPLDRRQQLLSDIIVAETEYQIALAKKNGLGQAVEEYSVRMAQLPDAELELARLERDKAINVQVYQMLVSRYEEAKIAEQGKVSNIRILEQAYMPENPISPKVRMNILLGILLGIGLGVGAAFLLDSLNTKITTLTDVERYVKLPVIGTIPDIEIPEITIAENEAKIQMTADEDAQRKLTSQLRQMKSRLVPAYHPKSPASEAYRTFRTNLTAFAHTNPQSRRTFLITSSGPREGKSLTCANLAITLAQMDSKTLLVDTDMRRPIVHNLFGVERDRGLATYILNGVGSIADVVKPSDIPNLDLVTSGSIPPNPSELLASERVDSFIEEAKKQYDYIIFDLPPVIAVTDALIMAKKVDGLVLVIRTKITDRDIIDRAKKLLENIGVSPIGIVVNGIEVKKYYSGYKYYYYYYYYYEHERGKKGKRRKATGRASKTSQSKA
ncbi:MAG: GumC family protein [Candidatus Cloacimonadia bacterium]